MARATSCLKTLAKRALRSSKRLAERREGGEVSIVRLSGDEFAIIVLGIVESVAEIESLARVLSADGASR